MNRTFRTTSTKIFNNSSQPFVIKRTAMPFKGKKNIHRNFTTKSTIGDAHGCLKKTALFCENRYNTILLFFFFKCKWFDHFLLFFGNDKFQLILIFIGYDIRFSESLLNCNYNACLNTVKLKFYLIVNIA